MTINVSQLSRNEEMPVSAWLLRRLPSNENGLVTTPTVKAPSFLRLEGVEDADLAVRDRQQPVVGDHDEGVAALAQGVDAGFGLRAAALALERERPGDHTDGQCAQLAGDTGDDGRPAGPGPAALTGGDEHHVRTAEQLFDLILGVLGGLAADFRVRPGPETSRGFAPDV